MQHCQKWLEFLPFPLVITNAEDCIEHYNFLFARLAGGDTVGADVKTLFDQWKPEESFLVSVTLHNRPYVLLHHSILVEEQPFTLYIVADTTPVQQLRQEVANLETQLEAVMESSNDGIYITDEKGVTLKVNRAIEKMTGYPKHCFVGHNVADLVKEGTLKRSITLKVLEERKRVDYVYQLSERKAFATGIPILKENGEIDKIITNVRDLTEVNHYYNELQRAFDLNSQYRRELDLLKGKLKLIDSDVVIESKQMIDIYDMAERVADVDATVLILGETGVGKDVLARHLYASSKRSQKGEFIKVNCGAIPYDLLESELFGYEAGAFTGANKTGKPGMFELADNGMLFLDEVGELPLALQVKLLRVLQEKEIQRIGATKSKKIDVRLIAATNRELKQMVAEGKFREDLFFRLNVLPISIPPLRERKEDIVPLANSVLEKVNRKYSTEKRFDDKLESFFYHYKWSGNVRELTNLVERLVLTVPSSIIMVEDLPVDYAECECAGSHSVTSELNRVMTLKEAAEIAEREILALAVQKFHSTYKMAEELGTSQATIVRKLKKYKL
ncbi:sigma-54 interaction domain-containing protein [Brevibacillus centrosporus]|uniref:HTH-type transcriptional regulatory protein TyrR n=1 Tax=Brevibacillus centrosporus TaxID=54910 RepID=A0A1I3LVQ8_9BACL|nr:sigma 54-interacting transcriptional regulator [Brevibacillus centrosporus]SFI88854.1 PAS domain S-box-containing protein [Brevibacillus centrosporus]